MSVVSSSVSIRCVYLLAGTCMLATFAVGFFWPRPCRAAEGRDAPTEPVAAGLWSLQPLQNEAATQQSQSASIDAFIRNRLRAAGLTQSPPADRRSLIRRLFFTLHGLPPTFEQITSWTNDEREDWYERLVDELLASPRYGERWARHWLDLVRYADSTGFETNRPRPNAWLYRDYVIAAFNDDKPFDDFVFEQLAGDLVGEDAATGFLVAGPHDIVAGQNEELTLMQRSDELADIVNATTTAFLGLTVACARCHDHMFDPISQQDYYATEAVFAGVHHAERPLDPQHYQKLKRAQGELQTRIQAIETELESLKATHVAVETCYPGATIGIDDEGPWPNAVGEASFLELTGDGVTGEYPAGIGPGQRDDPGSASRTANVSGGKYRYWRNASDAERLLCSWGPGRAGRFRVWLSWAVAPEHDANTTYVLDRDGDLETAEDQTVIARINQREFAWGSLSAGIEEATATYWSGFYDAGTHEFTPASRILLTSGRQGAAATADVLILQEDEDLVQRGDPVETPLQPKLRPAVNSVQNVERFPAIKARYVRFDILATDSGEPGIDELEIYNATDTPENVALAAAGAKATASGVFQAEPQGHRLELVNDGKKGNGSTWICDRVEGGWVQIELPKETLINRVVWSRDAAGDYSDRVATRYRVQVSPDAKNWRTIASSEDRFPYKYVARGAIAYPWVTWSVGLDSPERQAQLVKLLQLRRDNENKAAALANWPMAYAGTFRQPNATHLLQRGDPMLPQEKVAPDCLSVIGSLEMEVDEEEQKRREAFAEWICDPELGAGVLAARVIVNRLWQHQFGRGLVATPSDFGENGIPPSHPKLLDFLAQEFIDSGWSIKHVQRLIVQSDTFRQSCAPRDDCLAKDAGNAFLWRFAPRRVEAEVIRDSILAVSGKLDLTIGGPGFSLLEAQPGNVYNYVPKTTFGPPEWRRMIYAHQTRGELDSTFGAFDCPDGGQVAPLRPKSTTALQALNLLNSPFILQQAEFLEQRVEVEAGDDLTEQVNRVFQLIFQRTPTRLERDESLKLVREYGLAALCRALFNANEFLFMT